jgi:type II secretory pathway pseudopilin PulG
VRLVRDERGVTLTELIAAIFIAMIVLGAAVTTFVTFIDVSTRSDNQHRAQDVARSSMERLSAQVRNAMTTGSIGATPIESLSAYDFVFLAPLPNTTTTNNPRGLSHIRYCLSNLGTKADILWYQTKAYNSATQPSPPSTSTCPASGWGTQNVVAEHLVNRTETGAPALFTRKNDSTGVTTHVIVRTVVDWNPNTKPGPTTLFTSINMRNVNRVPTASMTCSGLANGHIVCDAGASMDPDGQSLSYSWTRDGAALNGQVGSRLDHSPNVSKTTHTIVVTVTDPGGATATATRQVTIP